MQKADELIKNKNYSKAANILEKIIEEHPEHINALYKASRGNFDPISESFGPKLLPAPPTW